MGLAETNTLPIVSRYCKLLLSPEILDELNLASDLIDVIGGLAHLNVLWADGHHGWPEKVIGRPRAKLQPLRHAFDKSAIGLFKLDVEEIAEAHEVSNKDILGPVVDLLRRADLHEHAFAQHHDTV